MTEPQKTSPKTNRRGLLVAGGVFAAVFGGGALVRRFTDARLSFDPDPRVPGFRRLAGGEFSSGASSPLAGVGSARSRVDDPDEGQVCDWLFPDASGARVPVAYFSDIACPYCRILSKFLDDRRAAGEIDLWLRDFPVFGEASEQAARAGIAAGFQGKGLEMHRSLMGGRQVMGPARLRAVAEALGLDLARFEADMDGEDASTQLARNRGLARAFRFPGTPGMVVGRTVMLGSVSETRLDAVIAAEAQDLPFRCKA